jgi:hypothetical protein
MSQETTEAVIIRLKNHNEFYNNLTQILVADPSIRPAIIERKLNSSSPPPQEWAGLSRKQQGVLNRVVQLKALATQEAPQEEPHNPPEDTTTADTSREGLRLQQQDGEVGAVAKATPGNLAKAAANAGLSAGSMKPTSSGASIQKKILNCV